MRHDRSVLVLTTFDLDEIVHDTLEAGADGFLLKRSTPDELIAGIRTVAAGDALISATLTRRLLGYVAGKKSGATGASLVVPLTEREAEVLRYLTEGLSNAEIAEKLVIGHETVKTHVKRICMKTGAARPHAGCGLGLPDGVRRNDVIRSTGLGPCMPATAPAGSQRG